MYLKRSRPTLTAELNFLFIWQEALHPESKTSPLTKTKSLAVCIPNIITMPNWSRGVEQCSFITALFLIIPNDMIHACSISSNKQINVNSIILIGVKIERLLQFIALFCVCVIRKTSWFNKLVPIRGKKTSTLIFKMHFEVPFKTNKILFCYMVFGAIVSVT